MWEYKLLSDVPAGEDHAEPVWELTDGRILFYLQSVEFLELFDTVEVLLGKESFANYQRKNLLRSRYAPSMISGELATIDPQDSETIVLRLWGSFPAEFCVADPLGCPWRLVEYRISKSEAEQLLEAEYAKVEEVTNDND